MSDIRPSDFLLRLLAYQEIRGWEASGLIEIDERFAAEHLRNFIKGDFVNYMTDEHREIFKLLAGPHGWTVYNMLKARSGYHDGKS